MRDWSTGSVTKHGTQWRARLPRSRGRRSLGLFATEAEAVEVLAAALARLKHAPVEAPTLAAVGADWIKGRDVRPGTARRDAARWSCYVERKRIGTLVPAEVSKVDVEEWLASLRGLAAQTRQNALCLLRQALDDALDGTGRVNPALGVKLKRRAHDTSEEAFQWLRLPELADALKRAPTTKARHLWTVAAYSGLRMGELCGLRWEDVDTERNVLHVRFSRSEPTKGGKPRDVDMLAPVVAALRDWRRAYERDGVRSHLGLVFPARDGGYHDDGYDAGWYEMAKGTRLARASVHDLRHTCASHLLQGSWAPRLIARALRLEEVRDWLGHKDIKTTQRYAKLCRDSIGSLVRRSKRDTNRDTKRSRPRDLNSGPTVYEKVVALASYRTKAHVSREVSRAVTRLHDAAIAACEAVRSGDPHRDERSVDLADAAADMIAAMHRPGVHVVTSATARMEAR